MFKETRIEKSMYFGKLYHMEDKPEKLKKQCRNVSGAIKQEQKMLLMVEIDFSPTSRPCIYSKLQRRRFQSHVIGLFFVVYGRHNF